MLSPLLTVLFSMAAWAQQPPVLLKDVVPEYPEEARTRGLQGDVVVLITVLEDGTVGDAEVVQGAGTLLDLVSQEAARQLLFEPAMLEGEAVVVQLHYRFHFDLGIADEQGTAVPGSLHGVVTDADGLPVPGAAVTIAPMAAEGEDAKGSDAKGETLTLESRPDGSFRATFLPSGRYVVRTDHPAFSSSEVEIEIRAGENLQRQFMLLGVSAQEIVVTYQQQTWREVKRGPLEANAGTVTGSYTLTRRDVESSPGALEDVSRAVHSLPGVAADTDMLSTFHARGGETRDVVFLLDRVPLDNPFHLAGFNSLFNPDMISSVQYFAGAPPASVPSGTSAVLSVESWDGTPRQESSEMDGALDVSASSLRALVMGPVGEDITVALAVRRSYLESYFQVMKWANLVDTAFSAPEFSEVSARVAWRPTERQRWMASILRAGDSLGIVDSEDDSALSFDATFELDNRMTMTTLDHRLQWDADTTWQTTGAWIRDDSFVLRDLGGEFQQEAVSRTAFARTDLLATRGKHALGAGVDTRWRDVTVTGQVEDRRTHPTWYNAPLAEYESAVLDLDTHKNWSDASVWAEDEWQGPLRIRGGGRATFSGATNQWLLSPRAGVSLPLPTGTIPKASAGVYHTVLQDPLLYDPILGNPDLQAEQGQHLVVGIDQAFPLPGEEGGGLLRVEAYTINLDHLVVNPDTEAGVDELAFTNDGTGTNRGVDVLLAGKSGRFRGTVTWSILEALRKNPLNRQFATEYAPAQDQRHTLGTTLEYQLTPYWRTTVRYAYHTGRPVSAISQSAVSEAFLLDCVNCERLGPTHNADIRGEWRKAMRNYRLSVYAEVLNVTNAKSDFVPLVAIEDGERQDGMLTHLPLRPFLGVRADF